MLLPVLASFAAAITPIAAAPLSMSQHQTQWRSVADPMVPEIISNFPVRQPIL